MTDPNPFLTRLFSPPVEDAGDTPNDSTSPPEEPTFLEQLFKASN
ncbi:hypothetical protein [Curtobacterium sp. MCBD17_013]|nr:hypothetical protein [Curtobacterium sp. MCBD17_013]